MEKKNPHKVNRPVSRQGRANRRNQFYIKNNERLYIIDKNFDYYDSVKISQISLQSNFQVFLEVLRHQELL